MIGVAVYLNTLVNDVPNTHLYKILISVACAVLQVYLGAGIDSLFSSSQPFRKWLNGDEFFEGFFLERLQTQSGQTSIAVLHVDWYEGSLRFTGIDYGLIPGEICSFSNFLASFDGTDAELVGRSKGSNPRYYFVRLTCTKSSKGVVAFQGESRSSYPQDLNFVSITGRRISEGTVEGDRLLRLYREQGMENAIKEGGGAEKFWTRFLSDSGQHYTI